MGASILKFPLTDIKIVESNLADIVSYNTVAVAQVNTWRRGFKAVLGGNVRVGWGTFRAAGGNSGTGL